MPPAARTKLRVEDLAEAKKIEVEWLVDQAGLSDTQQGVEIPYWDGAGDLVAHKLRTALAAKDGSFWPKGLPLRPYGLWRLHEAERLGYLILVEGESDCWALWRHKLPALGIPGANATKVLCKEHVVGVSTIHVHQEPGKGGQQFVDGICKRLALLGWPGQLLLLTMSGFKDPADLQAASPRLFAASMKERLDAAVLMPLAQANGNGNGSHGSGEPREGAQASAPPEWEAPVPFDTMPAPAPFPLEALPAGIADYISQCAWATNSPPDFVAIPLLAIAAGCIGASRALSITRDHVQPATLFMVVVGAPGSGKSPALDRVLDPVHAAERRFSEKWKRMLAAWQEEEPEVRGDKPMPRRLFVDDTSTEAMMKVLRDNQRGLLMVRDELAALIAGMDQYKSHGGHDRQIYLKLWAGATIVVDRKSNEGGLPLVVRRPSLSIVGGIQPDVIESYLVGDGPGQGANDGFLDRFLFSFPADLPAIEEQWREVEAEVAATWDNAVQWLLSLEQYREKDGSMRHKLIGLDGSGKEAWVEFTRRHTAEINATGFAPNQKGPWSKLRGYCARLALVLHYLRSAVEHNTKDDDHVDGEDIANAETLIRYFKLHYQHVAARMGTDRRRAEAGRVLGWIRRLKQEATRFSRRQAYKDLANSFPAPDSLDRPLGLLLQHGYIREVDVERAGPGRKPSAIYDINPLWVRVALGEKETQDV